MNSVRRVRERIQDALGLLQHQWQTTSALWNDLIRQRFESDFIADFEPTVSAALKDIAHLEQTIMQARRSVK